MASKPSMGEIPPCLKSTEMSRSALHRCPPQAGAHRLENSPNWYDSAMTKRKPTPDPDELLTSPQAAEVAGLDRTHFARLVREGKGPEYSTMPVGTAGKKHMVLIRRGDLMKWLAARQE